ncbi:hypothetical protein H2199_007389 [Coniosporium tulheliwenetii]|uniref:Uncharacterized protein n=1 Tax=Coniosporium tulheliwenetii TaxID=3383036 RepID=A0ACC2YRP7_9PEZI|nr:hypothetical protein H2199_007389 [Cladosporium sp. JES 115]
MPTPIHESDVLIPQDTSTDENDWAQIELGNVEVYNAGGTLVSLLQADWDRPLTVVGRLQDVEEEQAHLLRNPSHANATIKVTNVTRFSYAEYSDKSVALYARGEAGWFILGKPARPYRGIYQDMIEAVEVMYFLVDYHRQTSKDIFEEAAAELFNKHREFLVWMMLAKKENVTWGATATTEETERATAQISKPTS